MTIYFEELKKILERIAVALEQISVSVQKDIVDENNIVKKDIIDEADLIPAPIILAENAVQIFLASKGVKIKALAQEDKADDIINSLSDFLGKNYQALGESLLEIKRNMQKGSSFTICIKDYTQKHISDTCQFFVRLHDVAFLEQYTYQKSPYYIIKAKTTTLPTAQAFFSGKWLERYVLLSVKNVIAKLMLDFNIKIKFSYLLNPQVILPNGDDFELDIIFSVNDSIFWIEAKSGDYQQHISKYKKIAKLLGLDYEHSFMVLTDISPERSDALSVLFDMTVCALPDLESVILEAIKLDVTN